MVCCSFTTHMAQGNSRVARPGVIKNLLSDFQARSPMRTTSLIVSLFGDVVSQHGGVIWMGSLVHALGLLGLNDRLVRTSVFRMVQDGWLESEKVGRRSYYRFSVYGSHEYERAARRVYAVEREAWHGRWQLLIPLAIAEGNRERFKRSLLWQGFRQISAGTFARPGDMDNTLLETLAEFDANDQVILMEAKTSELTAFRTINMLVQEQWQLDEVAQRYREFLARFKQLKQVLDKPQLLDPESAFIARTLLIHDYRRVLLRDTQLPEELLPPAWLGREAMLLTSELYLALAQASMAYITTRLEGGHGLMPGAKESFTKRFVGK